MSSHALALGLSAFASARARRPAKDPRFVFGTWKIEIPGSYNSVILLAGIAGLIIFWARDLFRVTGCIFFDAQMDRPIVAQIRDAVAQDTLPARISDLHVWQIGRGKYACILEIVADADHYRSALSIHQEFSHIGIEICRIETHSG